MRLKPFVSDFYNTDFSENPGEIQKFLHPEVELFWNNTSGFNKMNYAEIQQMFENFSNSFDSFRIDISHLLREKEMVTIRFTYYVRTLENPEEELPIAHFMAIWEIKDEKLYRGHQISQQADDSPENLNSFFK